MPVIKSAKKKLRQDKKRTIVNKTLKEAFVKAVKKARKNPTEKVLQETTSIIDKTVKAGIIHKNKAARLKSSLAKALAQKHPRASAPAAKVTKPTAKPKSPAKKSPKKS
ncbi:MAG TPA: 30S ribosomal protein S20 [Candidatus Saccharimonadales bacterium]|nr:30S ribosomal protein S20 [Candidatus Saccharimonadales bacterium]